MSASGVAIAVVDDEAPVRKALGRLLRSAGFVVTTFGSGNEFLDSLAVRRPDCVILDLHLPGLSGLEIQQLLSQKQISVPCIIITGKDEPGTAERALACGSAAYLRKPVEEETLLSTIASVTTEYALTGKPAIQSLAATEVQP
jgi:FixJ family two-component response regulator